MWANGEYVLRTGRSLRTLPSVDLLDASYRLMHIHSLVTEEEMKAREKIDSAIANIDFESDTGMPAITQWMRPADEMYPAGIRPA
jgi:hypothetical protein